MSTIYKEVLKDFNSAKQRLLEYRLCGIGYGPYTDLNGEFSLERYQSDVWIVVDTILDQEYNESFNKKIRPI